jgi:MFS family permease
VPVQTNPRLLVAIAGLHSTLFGIPVITVFWREQIGMSVTDIMLLQAVFGVSVVLLEFPSGYFADRVGYRASLLVGAVLWIAGWLAYGVGTSFASIAAAEIVLGAGSAFLSGADRALLWVSLEATDRADRYPHWEGRARAAAQTSEAASAAAGGWLYALHPRLPLWMQVPAALLQLGAVLKLAEVARPRAPDDRRSHLRRAAHVLRVGLWGHRRLQAALGLAVALGLSSFVMVWLIQPYLGSRDVPVEWFGPFWAGAHLWLAGVSLASARVREGLGLRGALLGCWLLIPLGYAGLAASPSAWGALFYLCFMTLRGLQGPILATVMQQAAPAEDRAAVLSLAALLFRLAFVVVGPALGALVDRAGLDTALVVAGAGFSAASLVALAVFARAHPRAAGG